MKRILIIVCAALMVTACGHKVNRDELAAKIEQQEQGLDYNSFSFDAVDSVQGELVDLYRKFYKAFPNDSLAPEYMQRAANVLISMECTDEVEALLDSIVAMYPDYQDIGGCWFLKGLAYENAEMFDSARAVYSYFVENYPDHVQARDTRTRLDNNYIGMSDEEMLEAILNAASDQGLSAL